MGALEGCIEQRDAASPGLADAVAERLVAIREFDDFVNAVLDELAEAGISRRELADRAEMNAAALRRLLTDADANPTFQTMRRVADALNLQLSLHPKPDSDKPTPAGAYPQSTHRAGAAS